MQRKTNAKRGRRGERKKRQIVSAPFIPNRGDEIAYAKKITELCRPMLKKAYREIVKLYRDLWDEIALKQTAKDAAGDELFFALDALRAIFEQDFSAKAEMLAAWMVYKQVETSRRDFPAKMLAIVQTAAGNAENISGIVPGVSPAYVGTVAPSVAAVPAPVIAPQAAANMLAVPGDIFHSSEGMETVINASIKENVSLIKSIPEQFFDRITGAVTRSMQAGGSTKQLAEEIKQYAKMTDRRAKNIALDQTRKVYTSLHVRQFQEAGIKKFKWIHVGGSVHPRHYHMADHPEGLNGGIFSLDDPPVIERKTGIKGFPAQLPFCKCTMAAVFEE